MSDDDERAWGSDHGDKLLERMERIAAQDAAGQLIGGIRGDQQRLRERWTYPSWMPGADATAASTPSVAQKSDEQREKESAERKRVIANNKAWPAATSIRLEWIRGTLLKAKKLPADAQLMIAYRLGSLAPADSYGHGLSGALEWLEIKGDHWEPKRLAAHLEAKPADAERVNLAIAISAAEGALDKKEGWRHHEKDKLARYLLLLQSWGYGLSEIELEIVGAK